MTLDIGRYVKLINDRIKISMDASLKESGLTLSQTRVLGYIHSRGGRTTQKEIEDFLEVSHPTVVGIISRLEKKGFLSCYFDPDNKRSKVVCNTKKAKELSVFVEREIKRVEERLTAGLSEKEIGELRRMLQMIYNNANALS